MKIKLYHMRFNWGFGVMWLSSTRQFDILLGWRMLCFTFTGRTIMKSTFQCRDSNGKLCSYSLQVLTGKKKVVVLGELEYNQGMSITNNIERAIKDAAITLKVSPDSPEVVWVEYYPGDDTAAAVYDKVVLVGRRPEWQCVQTADWELWGVTPPDDFQRNVIDLSEGTHHNASDE